MMEDCPETDIEFDALGLTSAHKLRSAEGTVNLSGRVSRIQAIGKEVGFIANECCRFPPRPGMSESWKLCARRQ